MFEGCSNEGTVSLSLLNLFSLPPPVLKKKIEPSGGFTKALTSSKSSGIWMEVILLYKQDWEISHKNVLPVQCYYLDTFITTKYR